SKVTPKSAPRPQKTASKPVEVARADNKPVGPRTDHTNLPDGGQVTNASSNAGPALGLRYTILKVAGSSTVEVASDTVFHAGDRIQLKVAANNPGYLYV